MIYLGAKRPNIDSVAGIWKDELYGFLFDKRKDLCLVKDGYKIIEKYDMYFKKMNGEVDYLLTKHKVDADDAAFVKAELDYFKTYFDTIVLAGEQELEKEKKAYTSRAEQKSDNAKKTYQKLMQNLYSAFTQDEDSDGKQRSHRFFNKLGIKTCPYCNRLYTFTLNSDNGKTAPEYDHFYNKSDYPLFAVSFYNLVPSCPVCNHIKRVKKTATINPFFHGFESVFTFVDDNDESKVLSKEEVMKKGGGKVRLRKADGKTSVADKGNIETFALNEIYNLHDDYVSDIVERVQAYQGISLDLVSTFQTRSKTPQEVYDFVWGKYWEVAQYENRPLSKLTKDILELLDIKR